MRFLENSGYVIKVIANFVFMVSIVGAVIFIIGGIVSIGEVWGIVSGLFGALLFIVSGMISSVLIYSYGEIVESTKKTSECLEEINRKLNKKLNNESAYNNNPQEADKQNTVRRVRCPKCGTVQAMGVNCVSCGVEFLTELKWND